MAYLTTRSNRYTCIRTDGGEETGERWTKIRALQPAYPLKNPVSSRTNV
ncbi:hypothetical protein IQ270_16095 [Microcoleus sp. LEGE 07076]|nr:hypothetical protein [Microcoleus sp. LEGE 07076]MBE9186164.1 hypothetical protein [Microcoleus sp. LEGE 07076]